jgi:hypothetical protein
MADDYSSAWYAAPLLNMWVLSSKGPVPFTLLMAETAEKTPVI